MQAKFFWMMVLGWVFTWSWGFGQEGFEWVVKLGEYDYDARRKDIPFGVLKQGLIPALKNGKWGLLDRNGALVTPCEQDNYIQYFGDYAGVQQAGKIGYINTEGKVTIPYLFDAGGYFNSGFATVRLNGSWGAIDTKGQLVISCQYENIKGFGYGRSAVKLNGKWGYIDFHGKLVIPPLYEDAENFHSQDRARVKLNGKWGLVDSNGKLVVHCQYDAIDDFPTEGILLVRLNGKSGGIDQESGKIITPFQFDQLSSFYKGLAYFGLNGKYGYIDKTGRVVVDPNQFEYVERYYSEDFVRVKRSGKWGYAAKNGNVAFSCIYQEAGEFKNGLARVKLNDKWGYINKFGANVIPFQYDGLGEFHEGLASFSINGQRGYLDVTGKKSLILDDQNIGLGDFQDGFAFVYENTKMGIINRSGQILVPCQFDRIWRSKAVPNLFVVAQGKSLGAIKTLDTCKPSSILWQYPEQVNSFTDKNLHQLKACITSADCPITKISFYLNGKEQATPRDLLIKPTSCTGQYFEQSITLPSNQTDHEIELVVTTAGGTTRSTRSFKLAANPVSVKPPPPPSEKRVALIIGNRAYQKGSLANPVNDARLMESTLRKMGFKVIIDTNCTQNAIKKAIMAFGSVLDENTMALFYYAGHGVEVGGVNYMVPIEAQLNKEADTDIECVKMESVLDQMASAKTKKNILILDACRNNPFKRSWNRSAESRGIARLNPNYEALVLYAATPGNVADDGVGRKNGLFTEILVKNITTPGLELYNALIKIREEVVQASGEKQSPYIEGTPFRFFFVH